MNEVELRKLYDKVSVKYDVGTWDQFKSKMQTVEQRKNFFNAISKKYDIGDYDNYEARLSGTSNTSTNTNTTTTTTTTNTQQQPQSNKVDPSKVSQNFSCILKNLVWKDLVRPTDDANHITHTIANISGKEFHFYADGKFMYNDVKPYRTNIMGTWSCDGDSNFIVKTEDNAMFDSKVNKWSYNVNESQIIKKIVYKNLKSYVK